MTGTAQPFPPRPQAKLAATGVTLTASELAEIIGTELDEAERLLAVASAMVSRYAPDAPTAVVNEATVRFSGYLASSEASGYGAYRQVGVGFDVGLQHLHGPAFRNSGAAMLLSPWRIRRAGAI